MKSFTNYYTESESMPSDVGVLVVNMPSQPKSDWMTTSKLYHDLTDHFQTVKKIKGNVFVCHHKTKNAGVCAPITYTPEEIKEMQKTARNWTSTTVYRHSLTLIKAGDVVLDFGSGKFQNVKPFVEEIGAKYVPYDTGIAGINNPNLINGSYDVVMASNVLNVQYKIKDQDKAYKAYLSTICQLVAAVK